MIASIPTQVSQKLSELPASPGCYLMKDGQGKVIYVGKALVLRNRVRSYFHASAQHSPKTLRLVEEVQDISWWVTRTELEALTLENNLIKEYQPRFNIALKDDKTFPYIKINWQDDFPKIELVRAIHRDGARYFGPFTSARSVSQTLDALRRVFPYLDCDRTITGQDSRPCLYYHLKLCGGPCIGAQSRDEYRQIMGQLIDFLLGDTGSVIQQLTTQMETAAENLNFEQAALYRDRIKAAERIVQQQQMIGTSPDDEDCIAVAQDPRTEDTVVQVMFVRQGRLVGRESFVLEGAEVSQSEGENELGPWGTIVGAFIQQFYTKATFIPPRILVQSMPETASVLTEWLRELRGQRVELRIPQRGAKRKLMELAVQNAQEYLRVQQASWAADTNKQTQALAELQEILGLPQPPGRIECYDISTLQGTNTTGAMVVFAKGAPQKGAYRRFKINGKGGLGAPDDFASMREMLRRRFRRAVEATESQDPGQKARTGDESWRILPDLVIVDGGKGQLGIAVEVLAEFGLTSSVPVVGLAKREEEIFRPDQAHSLWLQRNSQALYLVQRIRDEAHRFGITYHRNLRSKGLVRSKLDDIPGIGPARRKSLLTYFQGDLDKIRQASIDELTAIPGMNRRAALAVKEGL